MTTITDAGHDQRTGRTVTLAHSGSDLRFIGDAAGFSRTLANGDSDNVTSDSWDPIEASFGYDNNGLLDDVNQGLGSNWVIVSAAASSSDAEGEATAEITDGKQHTTS